MDKKHASAEFILKQIDEPLFKAMNPALREFIRKCFEAGWDARAKQYEGPG